MDRRTTTILAADMVGYSAMMAANEESIIQRLRDVRNSLINPRIEAAAGRIVKMMGDGLLIEVDSPRKALEMAIDFQRAMAAQESQYATDLQIRFRIGINFGHVVVDGDDILGDAVNIAARLESLSAPGGICISRALYDLVHDAPGIRLIEFGPQFVKNLPSPVEVWGVQIEGLATPALRLVTKGDRPSVAVMAFDNMSSDAEQGFLADGISDDVISQLSRFRALFVVARSSTYAYKGSTKDLRQIARELGVRYVVQGSVRRGGSRLRVSAQLIEGATGEMIWTDHWDRTVSDLFALQDEITHAIVTAVAPELGAHERRIARRKPTESLSAWELCQKAQAEYYAYSGEGRVKCEALLLASITADPDFAMPHALLARLFSTKILTGRSQDPGADIQQGMRHAQAALAMDERLEDAHIGHAGLLMAMGQEAAARAALSRAEALNDNSPLLYLTRSCIALFQPDPDTKEMEEAAISAVQLNPRDPLAWAFQSMVGIAGYWRNLDHPDPMVKVAFDAACDYPDVDYYVLFLGAIVNVHFGQIENARTKLDAALRKRPDLTLLKWKTAFPFPYWPTVFATSMPQLEVLVGLGLPRQ